MVIRQFDGYGPQKRYAESLCRNGWVLNIDADEIVTRGLADEIQALFADSAQCSPAACRVRILTIYPGDDRPRLMAADYNVMRLYHRTVATYRDHPVFDRVETGECQVRQLRAPIWHRPHRSVTHAVEKGVELQPVAGYARGAAAAMDAATAPRR